MTFDKSITKEYDKLRAKRLGLPDGMKAIDDTELKPVYFHRKRKTCKKDGQTREKAKRNREKRVREGGS